MRSALRYLPAAVLGLACLVGGVAYFGTWRASHGDGSAPVVPAKGHSTPPPPADEPPDPPPPRDAMDEFTSSVLSETEDSWTQRFAEESDTYLPPRLRFFDGTTRSGCGDARETDGTFYCSPDRRLYVDKDFHEGLVERGAPAGSFTHAYVLVHSVGHHVQNLLGIQAQAQREAAGLDERGRKALQVRIELQADCFAGIWAHDARPGKSGVPAHDLDTALSLPASIGIELAQRHGSGVVVPDTYAHGTLPQRKRWFLVGYRSGLLKDCNSFVARRR